MGATRVRALQGALLKGKSTEAILTKRLRALQDQIESDTMSASQNAVKNPHVARMYLKRRANAVHQESILARQLNALQQRNGQLEMAIATTQVVESAQVTHRALLETRNEDAVDLVGDLMDGVGTELEAEADVAEAAAIENGAGPVVDIDEELSALQAQQLPDVSQGGDCVHPSPNGQALRRSPTLEAHASLVDSPGARMKHTRSKSVDVDQLLAWSEMG